MVTAAETRDRSRNGTQMCGSCGLAASITKQRTKVGHGAPPLTILELPEEPAHAAAGEVCGITAYTLSRPEDQWSKNISLCSAGAHGG